MYNLNLKKGNQLRKNFCLLNKEKYYTNPIKCKQCETVIDYKFRNSRKFCSHSCSTTYNNKIRSEETQLKMSVSLKIRNDKKIKFLKSKIYYNICLNCNKNFIYKNKRKTCSNECLQEVYSKQGRNNASKKVKRSKLEIELYDICKLSYNVSHNKKLIGDWDVDIFFEDYNIGVLWNGPWHYKEMNMKNHSLKQVVNRDRIKCKLFTENGFKIFIFQDNQFTPQSAFNVLFDYINSTY